MSKNNDVTVKVARDRVESLRIIGHLQPSEVVVA